MIIGGYIMNDFEEGMIKKVNQNINTIFILINCINIFNLL